MTCPRCEGLLVRESLLNPREGSPVRLSRVAVFELWHDPRRRHLHEPVRAAVTEPGPVFHRSVGSRVSKSKILRVFATFK
jgi:hypothetical protein